MSNLTESYDFLNEYAWREGYTPEPVVNVLTLLSALIEQEAEINE